MVQLPCTPVADTTGSSTYQQASMSTPHGPFLSGSQLLVSNLQGILGLTLSRVQVCGSCSSFCIAYSFYHCRLTKYVVLWVTKFAAPPQYEERHGGSGSSYSTLEGFSFSGMPQEMDLSRYFTYLQPTPATQEIMEEEVVPATVPQRWADYEKPRVPTSARKPKRARGER
jgi:hypothetical protein